MNTKKSIIFKTIFSILFAVIIFGAYFYLIFADIKAPLKDSYFIYGAICACFVFSLLFLKIKTKKILVTLALAVTVVADYFLVLMPSDQNKLIGTCVFCGVQLIYALYTLALNKSIGARVINLALRVALCLIAYFVLPLYFVLGTLEMICVMYIINFIVSIFYLLLHIKTEWLMLIGYLLFFVCDIFVGLTNGGAELLGITGAFLQFMKDYNMVLYCYIPGLFFIALSSVWKKED